MVNNDLTGYKTIGSQHFCIKIVGGTALFLFMALPLSGWPQVSISQELLAFYLYACSLLLSLGMETFIRN